MIDQVAVRCLKDLNEETYHTVDVLMLNEEFARMIKFISKQDPGGRVTTKKNKKPR